MDQKKLEIIFAILGLPFFLSFVYSLRLIGKKNIPRNIKLFPIYTSFGALIYILIWLVIIDQFQNSWIIKINKITILIHLSFFSYFICSVIKNEKLRVFIVITFIVTFLLSLIHIIIHFISHDVKVPLYPNIALTVFCLIYYLDIFNNISAKNLLQDSHFWFITALFLGVGVSLPILVITNLLLPKITNVVFVLGLIGPCFYTIMHLVFLKAISCSLKNAKS